MTQKEDKTEKTYICESCDRTVHVTSGEEIPVCCDEPMKALPLEHCTDVHPEMARNADLSEPCDDGRGQTFYKDFNK